jgi:hypothetical protein
MGAGVAAIAEVYTHKPANSMAFIHEDMEGEVPATGFGSGLPCSQAVCSVQQTAGSRLPPGKLLQNVGGAHLNTPKRLRVNGGWFPGLVQEEAYAGHDVEAASLYPRPYQEVVGGRAVASEVAAGYSRQAYDALPLSPSSSLSNLMLGGGRLAPNLQQGGGDPEVGLTAGTAGTWQEVEGGAPPVAAPGGYNDGCYDQQPQPLVGESAERAVADGDQHGQDVRQCTEGGLGIQSAGADCPVNGGGVGGGEPRDLQNATSMQLLDGIFDDVFTDFSTPSQAFDWATLQAIETEDLQLDEFCSHDLFADT